MKINFRDSFFLLYFITSKLTFSIFLIITFFHHNAPKTVPCGISCECRIFECQKLCSEYWLPSVDTSLQPVFCNDKPMKLSASALQTQTMT